MITVQQDQCLQWLTPARAAVLGFATYTVILVIAPVTVQVHIPIWGVVFFIFSFVMFFAGVGLGKLLPAPAAALPFSAGSSRYRALFLAVSGLGAFGMLCRFYDRFFVRGIELSQNVLERREAMEAAGSNIWSMLAAILFPFCFASLFTCFLAQQNRAGTGRGAFAIAFVLFFLPMADAVSLGSRSLIITTFALLFMMLLFFGHLAVSIRTLATVFITMMLLVSLSTWIFLQRLSAMGLLALSSAMHSGYAFTTQPNAWAQELMYRTQDTAWFIPFFVLVNLSQYVLHGVYEFFYFYQHFAGPHTWGQDIFGVYFRLGDAIVGGKNTGLYVLGLQPRPGVYTTFLGPVYADFGWAGPLFMMSFGLFAERLRLRVLRSDFGTAPLYFYLVLVVVLFPVVNMISNAEGLFVMTAFGMYWLMHRKLAAAPKNRT